MNIETLRSYCLSKRGSTEDFPFDENVLVFKVMGKMFAASNITSEELVVNLKCDPVKAVQLRDAYDAIRPGYHMNKKHWNTVKMDNSVPDQVVRGWIDNSYDLVVKGLPKKLQAELINL